jgi:hypothetical protein
MSITPILGRFWEKMQKSVIQKFSKFRPVFRLEFIFGKKLQQFFNTLEQTIEQNHRTEFITDKVSFFNIFEAMKVFSD